MKKVSLLFGGLLVCLQGFTQARFYTDNGTKEVTSLKVGMSDIKVTVPVPEEVGNHELVEVAIDYIVNDEYQAGNFSYFKEFKSSYLAGKKEVTLWIKAPGQPDGDFCSQRYSFGCYKIEGDLDYTNRDYTASVVEIRVIGKDVESYKWENSKEVPVYKYLRLSSHKIPMSYGDIETAIYSEGKDIKIERFLGSQRVSMSEGSNVMQASYSSEGSVDDDRSVAAKAVVFNAYFMEDGQDAAPSGDMFGGGEPAAQEGSTVETLKKSVGYAFFYGSNSYDAERYVDGISPAFPLGYYANEEDDAYFVESFAMSGQSQKGGKLKSALGSSPQKLKQSYLDLLEESLKGLTWEKGKIGNFDCEILDVQVYTKSQVHEEGDPETLVLNSGEAGKTKRLLLFIGEKDGIVYHGSLFKAGTSPISDEEQKFWDHMVSTFEIL